MPGGDKTGPTGRGHMTGRAAGYCKGFNHPGHVNPGPSGFFGRRPMVRTGRGKGYRHWYHHTGIPGWARYEAGYPVCGGFMPYESFDPFIDDCVDPEKEKDLLADQAEFLRDQLNEIDARLKELEKNSKPANNKKEKNQKI